MIVSYQIPAESRFAQIWERSIFVADRKLFIKAAYFVPSAFLSVKAGEAFTIGLFGYIDRREYSIGAETFGNSLDRFHSQRIAIVEEEVEPNTIITVAKIAPTGRVTSLPECLVQLELDQWR